MPANEALHLSSPLFVLLALVRPCKATRDSRTSVFSFKSTDHDSAAIEAVDFTTLSCSVGRIEWKDRVFIVDRSNGELDRQYIQGDRIDIEE